MLYMNDPKAYETILEGCRRDNGQRLVDAPDGVRSNPTRKVPRRHLAAV